MRYDDQYTEVSGIRTRFWQAGRSGPVVILIHGIASSIEDWDRNVEALSRSCRVFALDLVGCGLSDKPLDHDYSLRSLAGFVLEFMTIQQIERAHLAGFSLGGRLALECAHLAPDRVFSLVLADPAGVGPETIFNFRLATVGGLGEFLTRPSRFGMRSLLNAAFHDRSQVTAGMVDERLQLALEPGAQNAFLKTLRGFVGFRGFEPGQVSDLQGWLPDLACPVLTVWGERDRFVPARHATILKERLPDCRVEVYGQCGHLPQIEHSERFNRDVTEFLSGIEGG